ncbi:MAG: DUF2784 domain-containing protein [Bacteroidales bacterium]|nr:DUF2784 domain-containing protein [Bacteroidales bacterium]
MLIYKIIDIFFVVFHTILVIFNLSGWIWKKTRKLNLITLALTGASWLFFGMIVGIPGYCPLTDWHFRILQKLGKTDLPESYIKYLADLITGLNFNAVTIDSLTLYLFLGSLFVSLALNVRDLPKRMTGANN